MRRAGIVSRQWSKRRWLSLRWLKFLGHQLDRRHLQRGVEIAADDFRRNIVTLVHPLKEAPPLATGAAGRHRAISRDGSHRPLSSGPLFQSEQPVQHRYQLDSRGWQPQAQENA